MFKNFNFLLFVIQICTRLSLINAQCNVCGSAGIACTSETDFAVCNNGIPTSEIVATCPTYAYCDLDLVCANFTYTSTPSCTSACGVCTTDLRFACVDTNKFQMCYGTETPTSPVLTCPSGSVCDFYAAAGSFCGFVGSMPTPVCSGPYTPTTVTTPSTPTQPITPTQPSIPTQTIAPSVPTKPTIKPPIIIPGSGSGTIIDNWALWCRNKSQIGRFPDTTDTACKAYVYCYYGTNKHALYGNYYKCPGTTMFNPNTRACVDSEFYECISGIYYRKNPTN